MANNIFTLGGVAAAISSPPLVGSVFSISILLFPTLFFHNKDHHKFIADYKYAVRVIAVGKMIISGIIVASSLKDGDLYYKGEDQKCFKDELEVFCFDSSKVYNSFLGAGLMIDAMIDLAFKIPLSDVFNFDYS